MTRARKTLIALDATPYYHICVRAVRRSFLCGKDKLTGRNFDHRKQWLEDEMLRLSDVFAIDVTAYAILSNHYHVILHVDKQRTANWGASEVVRRWHCLFKGTPQSQAFANGEILEGAHRMLLDSQISTWTQRLMDISWFMRVINEKIARMANAEDGCTGRFWEGRFKSQALLDEKALLACMTYVDLNPIRAKIAKSPEASLHTSVKRRIEAARSKGRVTDVLAKQPKQLQPFAGNPSQDMSPGLPFRLTDYLELVDWTGRQIRDTNRGQIDSQAPPILQRLDLNTEHWLFLTQHFQSSFKSLAGPVIQLRAACRHLGWKKCHSLSMSRALFG
jgi:REP element-mobilizing transposase RayT